MRQYEYGCEYKINSLIKLADFKAHNADEARMKMMKFAEKNDAYVQYIGRRRK